MDGANKRLRDSFRVSLGKYYALATVLYFTLSSGTVEATCYVSTCSIFSLIVATIVIPFQIVMIPLYILTVNLGLRNTYLGIILPNIVSAFGIFLLRQAIMSVPLELEEAARIDGCSELGIWWNIMLPAIRPALFTLAIFVFIGSWSDTIRGDNQKHSFLF